MKRILDGITPRSLLAGALLIAIVYVVLYSSTSESDQIADRPWPPEKCIELLRDADPLMRSYAIDDLLLAPDASVEYVVRRAHTGDERTAEVCVEMLGAFLYVDDPNVQAMAIDALFELRDESSPLMAVQSRQCLLQHQERIGECCTEALQGAGALVQLSSVFVAGGESEPLPEILIPTAVVLGPNWHGGQDDLEWLCRMPRSPWMYLVDGDEVSKAGLEHMQIARPDIRVRRRGRACLGIILFHETLGIQSISPGSPAAAAGIHPSSYLVKFDGVPVSNCDDLIDVMADRQPGEVVELTLSYQSEMQVVLLRLGSDLATGICECEGHPLAGASDAELVGHSP